MLSKERTKFCFRCYAYPGENKGQSGYYAMCIDLSLATWRPTLNQAKRSLDDAIVGYLASVKQSLCDEHLSEKELKRRVYRRVRFFPFMFKYYAGGIISKVIRTSNRKFTKPVDMSSLCATA